MQLIQARNVNDALAECLMLLDVHGVMRPSRNGPVLAFPGPVTTEYLRPTERVLFSTMRNANPTFHLLESLWMLAGRNDVAFPSAIVKNMRSFTDDGTMFWGAYGWRWRDFFGFDQIEAAIQELRANPESRRVVVAMWNAFSYNDGGTDEVLPDFKVGQQGGKDVPCNTHIYFDLRGSKLNMTVCNRSNDILWGCYGANAVHMSILQEYVAAALGVPVGIYHQMSNDLHLYTERAPSDTPAYISDVYKSNEYDHGSVKPMPLLAEGEDIKEFDEDIQDFFNTWDASGFDGVTMAQYNTDFFNHTVVPMTAAWVFRKSPAGLRHVDLIEAADWRLSMKNWLVNNYGGVL